MRALVSHASGTECREIRMHVMRTKLFRMLKHTVFLCSRLNKMTFSRTGKLDRSGVAVRFVDVSVIGEPLMYRGILSVKLAVAHAQNICRREQKVI